FIEVFPGGPSPEEPAGKQSIMHICLAVDGLEGSGEDLRAKAITIDIEPKRGLDFNMQAWTADPDCNKYALKQHRPESAQVDIANGTSFPSSATLVKKGDPIDPERTLV